MSVDLHGKALGRGGRKPGRLRRYKVLTKHHVGELVAALVVRLDDDPGLLLSVLERD